MVLSNMTKKQIIAVCFILFTFIGSMAFESYESKVLLKEDNKTIRARVFAKCMERNNFEYSDFNCELCQDSALQIIPYDRKEIKEFKKKYRKYIKWAKTKAIEPATEEEFIHSPFNN